MVGRKALAMIEPCHQLQHLLREVIGLMRRAVAPQGIGIQWRSTGCAPDPEVDTIRIESVEYAEGLGDFEGAVMRQHYPTGADANMGSLGGDARDQDFGRRTRERIDGVMLGDPVALVTETI